MAISDSNPVAQESAGSRLGRYSLSPSRAFRPPRITAFDVIFVGQMLMIALFYSQSFNFVSVVRTAAFAFILGVNIIFAIISLWKNPIASVFSGVSAFLLMFYMWLFSAHFDTPFTGALIASFPGLLAGGLIGLCAVKYSLEKTLHLFFIACVLYAISFIVITVKLDPSSLTALHKSASGLKSAGSVMLAHSNSTDAGNLQFRIKVSPGYMTFGLLYALQKLRGKITASYGAAFVFFAACIYRSDFRFMLVADALAAMALLFPMKVVTKAKITFAFVLLLLVGFAVCAALSLNPFELMKADSTGSGLARALEGKLAIESIWRFPFLGTGLISQATDTTAAYGSAFMAPSDIGTYGIMMEYGIVGLVLAVLSNYLIYVLIKRMAESRKVTLDAQNVILGCFVFIVLYEVISTMIFEGDATLIMGMAVSFLPQLRTRSGVLSWRTASASLRTRKPFTKRARPTNTPVRQQ